MNSLILKIGVGIIVLLTVLLFFDGHEDSSIYSHVEEQAISGVIQKKMRKSSSVLPTSNRKKLWAQTNESKNLFSKYPEDIDEDISMFSSFPDEIEVAIEQDIVQQGANFLDVLNQQEVPPEIYVAPEPPFVESLPEPVPLPFHYLGRYIEENKLIVFVIDNENNIHLISDGDTVLDNYAVENISHSSIEFKHKEFQQLQTLYFGEKP